MTKKRMLALILCGVLLLFSCAMLLNYWSARNDVHRIMSTRYYNRNFSTFFEEYENNADYSTDLLLRDITYHNNPERSGFLSTAFAFGAIDRDGNILFTSSSNAWWEEYDEEGNYLGRGYVSLEEYMTSELKAEIADFYNKPDRYGRMLHQSYSLDKLELYFDGKKHHPVRLTFTSPAYDESFTFKFSNLPVTKTVTETYSIIDHYFYDLDESAFDHKYYVKLKKEVDEALRSFEFTDSNGGTASLSGGRSEVNDIRDDIYFVYFTEYSNFQKTVISDVFKTLTVYTIFLFSFAFVLISCVASILYDKNKRLAESKRAFTSAAAHELKTPLAVIQNQCECIMENISSIYDEALRMNGIVQSLLTFNRLADADKVEKTACDLSALVVAEVEKYRPFAQTAGVEFDMQIDRDVFINCNEELLSMAVDNYLSNAVKYSVGDKRVTVELKKRKGGFVFSVSNPSPPIDKGDTVWQILSRADKSRNSSGGSTGMGLPICKKIFDLHAYKCSYGCAGERVTFYFEGQM